MLNDMIFARIYTILVMTFLLSACGQQGPLYMPLENPTEEARSK